MLSISDTAIEKCKSLMLESDLKLGGLRVKIEGGGCSGFQYDLSFDVWDNDDMVFWAETEDDKFPVIVDRRSFLYVAGSHINYDDGLMSSGFTVNNPKANSTCGCGESFSV